MTGNAEAKVPVTVAIITKNEERYISKCLASVCWADEIVVVDAESDDRTAEICQDPAAVWAKQLRFFSRAWTGFKDQRNFSIQVAKNDWVFVLDADETCSEELAQKIRGMFKCGAPQEARAFKVRRIEYFLGKPISYGIWNPSFQDRFFLKQGVRYVNDVHEYPLFPTPPKLLHEPIHHAPDFEIEKFLLKMNRYTTIEALNRVKEGQRTNLFRIVGAFPAMFFKNYFYYRAYKDGVHGVVISLLEAVSRVVRHSKMWQLQQQERARPVLQSNK